MNDLMLGRNVVVRNRNRLISLTTAEKTTKRIDYLWFAPYDGGTYGFDLTTEERVEIIGSLVWAADFDDWAFEATAQNVYMIHIRGNMYHIASNSYVQGKSNYRIAGACNDRSYENVFIKKMFSPLPNVYHKAGLSYGLAARQYTVIYRGHKFLGSCFALLLGCFAVLLTDDLKFDALCALSGTRNIGGAGFVLKVSDIIVTYNPYIANMVLRFHNDPELSEFSYINE